MNSDYTLMKKKNIYILLLLAPVLFASCKVGKSYVRPEMALPDSLMQQQDSISIADEQWQAVYTDNTLRNLIARALEYNKDMLVAAARVKEMAAQKRISVANLLPQLNGKIEAEREVETMADIAAMWVTAMKQRLFCRGNLTFGEICVGKSSCRSRLSAKCRITACLAYDNCCGSGAGILRAGSTRYRIGNCPSDTKGS